LEHPVLGFAIAASCSLCLGALLEIFATGRRCLFQLASESFEAG
jgi:hypothetical protein